MGKKENKTQGCSIPAVGRMSLGENPAWGPEEHSTSALLGLMGTAGEGV